MRHRPILFVVGQGRSGTTALVDVLNAHPQLALGVERYKYLWARRLSEITPASFERERFFDFGDGATNITPEASPRWKAVYAANDAKWDTAAYVGDKMTRVHIEELWQTLPEAVFLCIVRSPRQVAASWNVRARNDADIWPASHDALRAVRDTNTSNRRIHQAHQLRPDKVGIVRFQPFFGEPEGAVLHQVLDFLGLPATPETDAAMAAAHEFYVSKVEPKRRRLSQEEWTFLDAHLDRRAWRAVCREVL